MTMANEKGDSISSKKIMKMIEDKMKKSKLSYSEINKLTKKNRTKKTKK